MAFLPLLLHWNFLLHCTFDAHRAVSDSDCQSLVPNIYHLQAQAQLYIKRKCSALYEARSK